LVKGIEKKAVGEKERGFVIKSVVEKGRGRVLRRKACCVGGVFGVISPGTT